MRPYGCRVSGCGKSSYDSVHNRNHQFYAHDYAGQKTRGKRDRLCKRCADGSHDGAKTEIGCIEVVAPPPLDFVCSCSQCREAYRERSTRGRSDSEGMVSCRF